MNGALANADRGIFHIQNANYWKFYNLEFVDLFLPWSAEKLMRNRFINGPYGVYNRDASNNYFEKIITRNNYETGNSILNPMLTEPS